MGASTLIALLLTGHLAAVQQPLTAHPIIGTWKLDVTRSSVAGVRLEVTETPGGDVTMAIAGQSSTFKLDSKDYPAWYGTVAAWKRVSQREWDSTTKLKGAVASLDRYVLSADGQTLTVTTEWKGKSDRGTETMVLTRVSGGPEFAGVWQGKGVTSDATAEYAAEGDRLRLHVAPPDQRWFAPLDGRDYPIITIDTLAADFTAAGRQTGPRTIAFVLKQKGIPVQHATLTVSSDGQTLEVEQVHGATPDAPQRSRLVFVRK
jgi:hypothetical protein